jgi:hypothetical protein
VEAPARKNSFILNVISRILFNIPDEYRARLENVWVDDLAYASAWRKHVSKRVEELKLNMIWVSRVLPKLLIYMLNLPFLRKAFCPGDVSRRPDSGTSNTELIIDTSQYQYSYSSPCLSPHFEQHINFVLRVWPMHHCDPFPRTTKP